MTIEDLGSIGEIVAAIATVATLVYLAIQIRSNTVAVRSAAAQTVHEAYASWYQLLAGDASLSQLVTDGLRDYDSLSEGDRARFVATFMASLSYCQDAFIKWREGSRGYCFGEAFQHHVENDIMMRAPHPQAKPMGAFSIAIGEQPDS